MRQVTVRGPGGSSLVRFIARPTHALLLVAGAALLLAVASSAARGFPPPLEHDEYSYLLGAETFKSGRLTNPTHPMWQHFETFHVLQRPTYNSKYPPANAIVIAAGWALTGHPIGGVWLGFVLMCVAICWMLQAWLGSRWSLGLSLAFASWSAASYWSYSYWGGAVAAGAGALLLGALYRIVRWRARVGNSIAFGVGLLVLANSRPYEGLLLALPVLAVLGRWLWRDRRTPYRQKLSRVVLPLAVVGIAGLYCMGRYNSAVTGSWHQLPYSVYQQARSGTPLFIWQQPHPVAPASNATMLAFTRWEDSSYRAARTVSGRANYLVSVVDDFVGLILPLALLFPVLLVMIALRNRWTRFALITIVWGVLGMGFTAYFLPHYAAPFVGLVLIVYGGCLQWMSRLRIRRRRIGSILALSIVGLWFLFGVRDTAWAFVESRLHASPDAESPDWPSQRQLIADTLSRRGRRNLVIVRYGDEHGAGNEWVYNAANIDASPVVWARDMGDAANRPLLEYFHDRAAWIVEVDDDAGPFTVRRYVPRPP